MVSTRPPPSKSSSPLNNPLVTEPKATITIGIIVTFMFHSFFQFPSKVQVLIFFPHSFSFILGSAGTAVHNIASFFFYLLIFIRSGLLAEIRWSVCMSKPHNISIRVLVLLWKVWIQFFSLQLWVNSRAD